MVNTENFTLRQILSNNDTTKLSLGNETYTPLKNLLKEDSV